MLSNEEKKRYFRNIFLLIFGLLLLQLCLGAAFFYFSTTGLDETASDSVEDFQGEKFEYPDFYYAESGVWLLDDPKADILKERKYISPSEREAYLVLEIKKGTKIKILKANQRWKEVQILDNGKAVARGWIDANNVKKALLLDKEKESIKDDGKEDPE